MAIWSKKKQIIAKSIPLGAVLEWITNTPFWSKLVNPTIAIREGYQSNPWVYACVKKRSDAAASVPLVVQVRTADGWQDAPAHPLQKLLDRPHPDFDRSELFRLFVSHADLTGDAFLYKIRLGNGRPVELYPMPVQDMVAIPGRQRVIERYKNTQTNVEYPTEDIVHLSYTNPENLYTGQSPLVACGKSVDIDNAAAAFQKVSMQNRGVPDGMVSVDADLTEEQWREATRFIRENMDGVGNARGTFVLSKSKYQQLSQTMIDLDFQAGRNAAMKQICAAFGVPEAMITGMDSANVASATQVRKSFWQDTVIPSIIDPMVAALNLSLTPDFGNIETLRIVPDYSNIEALQEDFGAKITNAQKLWQLGYPINAINQRLELGMGDVEGGDMGYIPSGMIPAGLDIEQEPPTAASFGEAYGEQDADGE